MDDGEAGPGESLAPKAQMVVTACWLTMKEVSLLTGELARAVPLPGGAGSRGDSDDQSDEGMLDPAQLKAAGAHLMKVLLVMKHNGAIEKTRVGLTCLGERLLRSSRVELSRYITLKPYTLHPIPYSLYPIPYTLYPIPYTLCPTLLPIVRKVRYGAFSAPHCTKSRTFRTMRNALCHYEYHASVKSTCRWTSLGE